jgi:hypothetical protein
MEELIASLANVVESLRRDVAADEEGRNVRLKHVAQLSDGIDAGATISQAKVGNDQIWLISV